MKIALLLIVAALIGGAGGFAWGFYSGASTGSEIMGRAAAQGKVRGALSTITSSVQALNQNDLAYSINQHQQDLNRALADLGGYAPTVANHWKCKNADQAAIRAASDYMQAHPEIKGKGVLSSPQQIAQIEDKDFQAEMQKANQTIEQTLDRALKFCQ